MLGLKDKLGPILWQFPPSFRYDEERFAHFFEMLPHDTEAAVQVAAQMRRVDEEAQSHRDRQEAPLCGTRSRSGTRAFWMSRSSPCSAQHDIALVVAETARKWPMTHDVTADFIYMRLHGDKELYRSGYGDKALDRWAKRIEAWHRGAEPKDAIRVSTEKAPRAQGARHLLLLRQHGREAASAVRRADDSCQSWVCRTGRGSGHRAEEAPCEDAAENDRQPASRRRAKSASVDRKSISYKLLPRIIPAARSTLPSVIGRCRQFVTRLDYHCRPMHAPVVTRHRRPFLAPFWVMWLLFFSRSPPRSWPIARRPPRRSCSCGMPRKR